MTADAAKDAIAAIEEALNAALEQDEDKTDKKSHLNDGKKSEVVNKSTSAISKSVEKTKESRVLRSIDDAPADNKSQPGKSIDDKAGQKSAQARVITDGNIKKPEVSAQRLNYKSEARDSKLNNLRTSNQVLQRGRSADFNAGDQDVKTTKQSDSLRGNSPKENLVVMQANNSNKTSANTGLISVNDQKSTGKVAAKDASEIKRAKITEAKVKIESKKVFDTGAGKDTNEVADRELKKTANSDKVGDKHSHANTNSKAHGTSPFKTWAKKSDSGLPPMSAKAANDGYDESKALRYSLDSHNAKQRALAVSTKMEMKKASSMPYWLAFLFSCLVVVGAGLLIGNLYGDTIASTTSFVGIMTIPGVVIIAGFSFIAIALFFVMALLSVRTADMKFMTMSMMEVANKLAEPDEVVEKNITMIGTAFRREVNSMNEYLEKAFDRANNLEELVSREVNQLEQAYGDRENKIRVLVDDLAKHHTMVVNDAKKAREVIFGAHQQFSSDIIAASENLKQQVDTSTNNLKTMLKDNGSAMSKEIDARHSSMLENFNKYKTELVSSLDNIGSEVDEQLSSKIVDLAQASDRASEGLSSVYEEHSRKVKQQFKLSQDDFKKSLEDNIGVMSKSFNAANSDAVNKFANSAGAIGAALRSSSESLLSTFNKEGQTTIENIAKEVHAISDKLEGTGGGLAQKLDDTTSKLDAIISGKGNELNEQLKNSADNVSSSLIANGHNIIAKIEGAVSSAEAVLGNRIGDLSNKLSAQSTTIATALNDNLDSFNSDIKAKINNFNVVFSKREDELLNSINGSTTNLAKVMESSAGQIIDRLNNQTGNMGHRISERLDDFDVKLGKRLNSVSEYITTYTENFYEQTNERLEDLTDKLDHKAVVMRDNLASGSENLSGLLNDYVAKTDKAMTAGADQLRQTFEQGSSGMVSDFGKQQQKLAQIIQDNMNNAGSKFVEDGEKLIRNIQGQHDKVNQLFNDMVKDINLTMEERSQSIERISKNKVDDILDKLAQGSFNLTDNISKISSDVIKSIDDKFIDVQSGFKANINQIDNIINQDGAAINSNLGELGTQLAQNLISHNQKVEQLSSNLSVKTKEIANTIESRINELSDQFQKSSSIILESVDSKGEQISSRIARESMRSVETLRDAIEEKLLETSGTLKVNAKRMSDDISNSAMEASDRVNSTIQSLSDLFDARKHDFSEGISSFNEEIKTSIGARTLELSEILSVRGGALVSNIRDRSSELAGNINDACDMLTTTLNSRGKGIIEEIKIQSKQATNDLDKAREQMLYDLVSVYDKIKDSNNSLKKIIDQSSGSLKNIELELSRSINSLQKTVDETSNNTVQTSSVLIEQSKILKKLSEDTITKVSDVGKIFENQSKQLTDAISVVQGNNRISEVQIDDQIRNMKNLSLEFVSQSKNIEETLKGLVDKVKDSTGSIKDVISASGADGNNRKLEQDIDRQYEKLEQINQAISKVSSLIDSRINHSKSADRGAATASVTANENTKPLFSEDDIATVDVIEDDNSGSENKRTSNWLFSAKSRKKGFSEEVAGYDYEVKSDNLATSKKNDSNGLSSLSREIASSINHQVIYDLWKKRLEGGQGSFNRYLYNHDGQKLFDDIKDKHKTDAAFRKAVDDYVADFEKLLAEIPEKDDSSRTVKLNYLTSDTGKVFTMLAHASGKLS